MPRRKRVRSTERSDAPAPKAARVEDTVPAATSNSQFQLPLRPSRLTTEPTLLSQDFDHEPTAREATPTPASEDEDDTSEAENNACDAASEASDGTNMPPSEAEDYISDTSSHSASAEYAVFSTTGEETPIIEPDSDTERDAYKSSKKFIKRQKAISDISKRWGHGPDRALDSSLMPLVRTAGWRYVPKPPEEWEWKLLHALEKLSQLGSAEAMNERLVEQRDARVDDETGAEGRTMHKYDVYAVIESLKVRKMREPWA